MKNKWLKTNITHENAERAAAMFTLLLRLGVISRTYHDYLIDKLTTLGLITQLGAIQDQTNPVALSSALESLRQTLDNSLEV